MTFNRGYQPTETLDTSNPPQGDIMKNSLNPQVIKVIQSKKMVGEDSKKRYATYFHDFEGNLLGIGDPALCKICLEFYGNYILFCTSDHK